MRKARIAQDGQIETFAASLTEEFLAKTIEYQNNAGKICTDPTDLLVAHFFNHQTHHRGHHDMMHALHKSPRLL